MEQYLLYIWVGLMVASAVAEVLQFQLYAAWFALSALMAALLCLFGLPLWSQILVFIIVPAITIPLLRPVLKKRWEAKKKEADERNLKDEKEGR